jgi:hypothetical protein
MSDMIAPITFEMKVYFTNGKGETAHTMCDLQSGVYPNVEDIHRLIGESLAVVKKDGFQLMDGEEFFNQVVVRDLTGRAGSFAVAGSDLYDVAALTETSVAEYEKYKAERMAEKPADAKWASEDESEEYEDEGE